MTKITFRPDHSPVTAEVLDLDDGRAVDVDSVAPLDDDGALVRKLVEAEVGKLGAVLDAIQVDVGELHAAGVHAHQLKRRARDIGARSGALRDAAHERRLARTELARQK